MLSFCHWQINFPPNFVITWKRFLVKSVFVEMREKKTTGPSSWYSNVNETILFFVENPLYRRKKCRDFAEDQITPIKGIFILKCRHAKKRKILDGHIKTTLLPTIYLGILLCSNLSEIYSLWIGKALDCYEADFNTFLTPSVIFSILLCNEIGCGPIKYADFLLDGIIKTKPTKS